MTDQFEPPVDPAQQQQQQQQQPIIAVMPSGGRRRPVTFTQFCQSLAVVAIVNLIGLSIAAFIGKICWNAQTWLTTLPDISWSTALAFAILLRIVSLVVRI